MAGLVLEVMFPVGLIAKRVGAHERNFFDRTTLDWVSGQRRAVPVVRRRPRWLGPLAAATVLLAAALFSTHAYLSSVIRARASHAVATKLGRSVSIEDIDLGWGVVGLNGVTLDGADGSGPIELERIVVSFDVGDALGGTVRIDRLDVIGPRLALRRDKSGAIDIAPLLTRVANLARAQSTSEGLESDHGGSSSIDIGSAAIELHDVTIDFSDELSGAVGSVQLASVRPIGKMAIEFDGADLRVNAENSMAARAVQRSRIVNGRGHFGLAGQTLSLEVRGEVVDRPGATNETGEPEAWSLNGRVELADELAVTAELSVDNILPSRFPIAEASGGRVRFDEQARVSSQLSIEGTARAFEIRGQANVAGVEVFHPLLTAEPVRDLDAIVSGTIAIDRDNRTIALRDGHITRGDVRYEIDVEAALGESRKLRQVSAKFTVPPSPCDAVMESASAVLAPLKGFKLSGTMAGETTLAIDWSDFDATVFESTLDLSGCKVVSAPPKLSADRLRQSFDHKVPVGPGWISFVVGEENPDYVPLSDVSRHLVRSVLTTEDSRFYRHGGFVLRHFRDAMIKNLKRGRFAYGGSSITMQVVKNVMLERRKTVARKLTELFLTWYLEDELSKDRLLEIYVNAIEFGPGLYGIKQAAQQFFAKHPRRLNPVESAFISSILPAPTRRFKKYCRGWVGHSTNDKIDRILEHMLNRNRLNEEQYMNALMTPLVFRGRRNEICQRYKDGTIGAEYASKGTQ